IRPGVFRVFPAIFRLPWRAFVRFAAHCLFAIPVNADRRSRARFPTRRSVLRVAIWRRWHFPRGSAPIHREIPFLLVPERAQATRFYLERGDQFSNHGASEKKQTQPAIRRQQRRSGNIAEDSYSCHIERSRESLPSDIIFREDRKSTRLNSSHSQISYAVF